MKVGGWLIAGPGQHPCDAWDLTTTLIRMYVALISFPLSLSSCSPKSKSSTYHKNGAWIRYVMQKWCRRGL
eukprot:scaffold81436_cov29-Prasinocladus_malaysianus.AAC.1